MIKVKPILVNDLFLDLNTELTNLLKDTPEENWHNNTACEGWDVKDIVSHILKDYILLISRKRDKYRHPDVADQKFDNNADRVRFIAELNQSWVDTMKTLSPKMLIELLDFSIVKLIEYFNSVDLYKVEAGVSWISSERLPNWMDIAREYTEHWLHQAHIREGLGAELLTEPKLFSPLIRAYMLGVPKAYEDVTAKDGTVISITVAGDSGGVWTLQRNKDSWDLTGEQHNNADSIVTLDQDTLWRLFSKGISRGDAQQKVKIDGDIEIGSYVLNTVSLIA